MKNLLLDNFLCILLMFIDVIVDWMFEGYHIR